MNPSREMAQKVIPEDLGFNYQHLNCRSLFQGTRNSWQNTNVHKIKKRKKKKEERKYVPHQIGIGWPICFTKFHQGKSTRGLSCRIDTALQDIIIQNTAFITQQTMTEHHPSQDRIEQWRNSNFCQNYTRQPAKCSVLFFFHKAIFQVLLFLPLSSPSFLKFQCGS